MGALRIVLTVIYIIICIALVILVLMRNHIGERIKAVQWKESS